MNEQKNDVYTYLVIFKKKKLILVAHKISTRNPYLPKSSSFSYRLIHISMYIDHIRQVNHVVEDFNIVNRDLNVLTTSIASYIKC